MDIFKFLPLIFRLIALEPKVVEALRSGASILDLLKTFGPDILSLIQGVGAELFPNLPPADQAAAGALKTFDQTQVRWIQDSMNKLGIASPALVVDGNYGQRTKDAVTKYQTAHSLTADGWAGNVTAAAIQTDLNKLAAPAVA